MDECQVILYDNLFERNTAPHKGGAMRYVNKNFTSVYEDKTTRNGPNRRILSDRALKDEFMEDTNVYRNNWAKYAPNIASVGATYSYIFYQDGKEYSSEQLDKVVIAPGQDIVLKLFIYDHEGRLFNEE